ncbi:MAG TPA: hypothetical protein ENH11_00150 [Candidatus Acetothermia bacterium]|nr:hypothetical protein [Candidatus Acetothermia bacterium]
MPIPISAGSVFRFNQEAHEQLEAFGQWAKTRLAKADLLHADETGINVGGKRHWLHCASNPSLTRQRPNVQRPTRANARGNGAGSNDRSPGICWRGCGTSSGMSCASWRWRTSPSPTMRGGAICA